MNWLIIIVMGIALIVTMKNLLLVILLKYNFNNVDREAGTGSNLENSFVSVVVPVRNEAATITRCVQSIINQEYSKERFELLVGNDGSTDGTFEILRKLESEYENLKVYDIVDTVISKPGKMNVLSQLIDNSKGDIILITDGDTEVPTGWITNMTKFLSAENGVVTGTTLLKSSNTWGRLQSIDWGFALAMLKVLNDIGIQVASLGNNMGVTREAYESIGGLETIPFSVTEDYQIHLKIRESGFKSWLAFTPDVLALSQPTRNLYNLVQQRKRWIHGAVRMPVLVFILLFLDTFFLPAILVLIWKLPVIGVALWLMKILIQWIFITFSFKILKHKVSLVYVIPFEIYQGFVNITSLIVYVISPGVTWKGRRY